MLALGLGVAALAALLDQLSKLWVLRYFGEAGCASHMVPVTSFFDFILTCNRGVSFGMFNQPGEPALGFWIFSVIATIVVIALIVWLFRVRSALLAVAIGLIIGGAIGNVVDRLRLGGVVDFLYFHAGAWYWPAFNLADSAICLGVAAMLLDGLLLRRAAPQAKGKEDLSR
jgi:signal peptidase II